MKLKLSFTFILLIISVILLIGVFKLIDSSYECYTDMGQPDTTHTVSMPINTLVDCTNKCAPTGRCYKTGQQCLSDIDCPGCNMTREKNPEPSPDYSSLTISLDDNFSKVDISTKNYYKQVQDLSGNGRPSLTGEFTEYGPLPSNY
jgi:hypothetical protein